jgi:IS30 family transposase
MYTYHPELVKIYFRRKGKKYQHNRKDKYQIKDRRMIDERSTVVELRSIMGHWEGDTIVGKDHQGAIATNVERLCGLLMASKLESATAENTADVIIEDFREIPEEFRLSVTFDNGREFARHKKLENSVGITVYFAHAYSPWERGSNENTNGLLREYIPKGTDLSTVSQKDLDRYVSLINNRPRKRLGYKTPLEVWQEQLARVAVDTGM